MGMRSTEPDWPDDTIVVLPETPRVRLSPRRKMMNPQTPGWEWAPTDHIETIRMYHDPDPQDEAVDFTMNPEFIQSIVLSFSVVHVLMTFRYAIFHSCRVAN